MSVTTELPNVAAVQALARQPGQTVDARVVGQQPNGLTEVQVGRQTMSLQLPTPQPVGTTLTLGVQQVEGQVRVSLLAVTPAPTNTSVPIAPTSSQTAPVNVPFNPPATQVQLSPLAQHVTLPPPGPSNGGAPVTAQALPPGAPLPPPTPPAQAYAPTHQQYSNPQAGARSDAPPQIPIATAVPPFVKGQVAMQPTPMPIIAAVDAGSAAQLGDRPPFGMSTSGQPFTQANLGAPARADGLQANPGAAAPAQGANAQATANAQAAIAQMVSQALPKQNSVAALNSVISAVAGRVPLPPDVLKAAQGVLGQQMNLDGGAIDPLALKAAVKQSGIFHETLLGSGQAQSASGDLKGALMGLQRSLGAWLGSNAEMVQQLSKLPPPLKGLNPRVRHHREDARGLPSDPTELGKILLDRTDASLARLRLHQGASMPEQSHTVGRQDQSWSLDIPVQYAGHHTVLNLQIQGEAPEEDAPTADRGWQVRFAIHLADHGEVGAQLSLRGKRTNVLIWADQEAMGEALKQQTEQLQLGLESVGLQPGAIIVRVGAPATPERVAGQHYVDATT
jgi:hypothetical protein